jgi:hypothetical protein
MLSPKHYAADVAAELVAGLREGTITLNFDNQQIPERAPKEITRRSSWADLSATAIALVFIGMVLRIRRVGSRITLDLAFSINAEASNALNHYIQKEASPVNLKRMVARASMVSEITGHEKSAAVMSALVAARAAEIAYQIPRTPAHFIVGLEFDHNGIGGTVIGTSTDVFIGNTRMLSSVRAPMPYGIRVEGKPNVVAYRVEIDGFKQTLDGIFWIETTLTDCIVSFGGGGVFLSKVRFNRCVLDASVDQNPMLKRAIIDAGTNEVSFFW